MDEPDLKIIDILDCELRKKLSGASQVRNYIETIWEGAYDLHDKVVEPRTVAGLAV